MTRPTPEKQQADSSNFIMRRILPPFSHLCHKCLNPNTVDPRDPRISPMFADADKIPQNVLLITAAQCPFAFEAEKPAEYIGSVDGKYPGVSEDGELCPRMGQRSDSRDVAVQGQGRGVCHGRQHVEKEGG